MEEGCVLLSSILQVESDRLVLARVDWRYEFDGCGFLEPVVLAGYPGKHLLYYLQLAGSRQNWLAGEVTVKDGVRSVEAECCGGGPEMVDAIKVV